MNKLIASIFGIGYVKGGGTLAALVTCPFIYLLWLQSWAVNPIWLVLATLIVTLLGINVGNKVEPFWGKDSYRVVIDEVAGMMVTMLFVPANIYYLLIGFVLFRFFDILKPLGIRKMEALKGGTGVMMDDVLAGVYGNIVLQVIVHFLHLHGNASLDLNIR
ncbi:phosphatidylglycerophosphatase A [Mucilaginibacter achroorhodeus]|uniref:Phosphatidylglycerophosphatase A n=1 Tax=Mucilaginibacter achroorhodeus TaxID=2599294 RepID=A0A563U2K9_9SPHI|nr:phosphatidylglycerophosphatase A [Mucilaginibacter achroorhodeus]TWR25581.1 phosphatidylglycerophosphatase A [Mucilaginibacter achroorhodeus]